VVPGSHKENKNQNILAKRSKSNRIPFKEYQYHHHITKKEKRISAKRRPKETIKHLASAFCSIMKACTPCASFKHK
jgi:hypothetical protein